VNAAGGGERWAGRELGARPCQHLRDAGALASVAQARRPDHDNPPPDRVAPASSTPATGRHGAVPDPFEQEFSAFFTSHEQALYGYLRRMLPPDESALEITQEAFFRAWRHFAEIRTYDRPEAWLFRVATNLAISHLRRHRPLSFSQVFRRFGAESDAGDTGSEAELLADTLDLEGQTAARDLIDRILQRLPPRQRAALLLRIVHGHSCQEIAQALGISLPNARQTLSRGRERFRALYTALQSPDEADEGIKR
jgi:RNA polymerase sigma-70 factor, ECF subfamily